MHAELNVRCLGAMFRTGYFPAVGVIGNDETLLAFFLWHNKLNMWIQSTPINSVNVDFCVLILQVQ